MHVFVGVCAYFRSMICAKQLSKCHYWSNFMSNNPLLFLLFLFAMANSTLHMHYDYCTLS